MTPEDKIRLAFGGELACPGLGAELVVAHRRSPVVRTYLQYLRQAKGLLAVPDTAAGRQLAATLGVPTQFIVGRPGMYSLATYPLGPTERVGAVRRFVPERASARTTGEFSDACTAGELAACRWLRRQVGFFEAPPLVFHSLPLEPLDAAEMEQDRLGRSAGLAACLAAAYEWLGTDSIACAVAASGTVTPDGRVTGVDHLEHKLAALLREAPFIRRIFLPEANRTDVPAELAALFEIEFVSSGADALCRAFGVIDAARLTIVDRLGAARFAVELETRRDHSRAYELALAVVENVEAEPPGAENLDGFKAEALGRTVLATNLNHQGHTRQARQQLELRRASLARASERVQMHVLKSKTLAWLAAAEASVWIDTLSPERAVEICEPLVRFAEDLDDEVGVALLGSWTRALSAAGRLDGAERASDRQLEFLLEEGHKGQRVQALCNRIDVLLRQHRAGDTEAIGRAEARHAEAVNLNASLPEGPQRSRNTLFLRFWRIRLHAAVGDAQAAAGEAGPMPENGRFPELYGHRFVAEAVAASGQHKEAVAILERLVGAINPEAGDFERLILHTADARRATILMQLGGNDWEQPAEQFLDRVSAWSRDFVTLPRDRWKGQKLVAEVLEDILQRLPY